MKPRALRMIDVPTLPGYEAFVNESTYGLVWCDHCWANSLSSLDAVAEPSFRQPHGLTIRVAPSGGIRTRYVRICHD